MKKAAWRKFKDYLKSLSEGQKTDGKLEIAADTTSYFIFNLSVGTSSPQNISGILDITTPLVWSQCAPCTACLPPPAPTFRPNLLPTFAGLPCASQTCQRMLNQTCAADACGYIGVYGDDTNTTGYLATDTFTFDNVSVPMVFGCSGASTGEFSDASGIFGFSRRPLSLVSQLELSWFSYLWASDDSSDDSFIKFGVITQRG
ncbi:aspartic proteinase nepenthesin-2-like [Setaria italica]|uniref:aspartic proteinase nepenthesin-2-like n=1 Tax=Setaria italica TaxID=4555 RepID=UPI000BE4C41E|nr:aspartic proteinase nepenthesin-2-like [Setaria italica]XP_034591683.1 aspartic proteinase nepenthesin-2-like [Setaria viridis]